MMRDRSTNTDSGRARADKRHLAGFRKFQKAALKAVDAASRRLDRDEPDPDAKARPTVKVSDMKSLVSAYKEAVVGERMVLGIDARPEGRPSDDWPDEMVIRWVDDEPQESDGEDADA